VLGSFRGLQDRLQRLAAIALLLLPSPLACCDVEAAADALYTVNMLSNDFKQKEESGVVLL
jgi:hypothetical protein